MTTIRNQEDAFDDINVVPLLPKEESAAPETLARLPGLQKLVKEYYYLATKEQLSIAEIERQGEIYELAVYDEQLHEWIERVDDTVALIELLGTKKLSFEEFIERVENTPVDEMTSERFQELAQQLEISERFLQRYIQFSDRDYHRSLLFQFSRGCVYAIAWLPGQKTAVHQHPNDLSAIYVQQGTLTHRYLEQVNHLYEQKGYRTKQENKVEANQWICVNYAQFHQLENESSEKLVTVHFRFFRKPVEDEFLENDSQFEEKHLHLHRPRQ